MRIGTTLLTLLALSCSRCEFPTNVPPPPRAERIQPRQEWRNLWADVEKCSGRSGNFDDVNWYRALEKMINPEGEELAGRWIHPHNIYQAPENIDEGSGWSQEYKNFNLGHEMLHDLLQTYGHPKQFDTCGLRYKP
ncbi:MAG: hypothetical protein U1B79_01015 [Candidatus Pacearchaeota archaeon]|nr:hypothetical protein [Nanoarchaeota archaeon]MDZ4226671.1 hypothetical protein [Candidatus Pacearchaeota archaeon]